MIPRLTKSIERANRKTNMQWDPTMIVLTTIAMRDNHLVFLRETVYLNLHPIRFADAHKYI